MTTPRTPLWELKPHTKAKHDILEHYLAAWFPILASRNARLAYVDGYAGPGRYRGGEAGSPLIALTAARQNFGALQSRKLLFVFVEKKKSHFDHLQREIESFKAPAHFRVVTRRAEFAQLFPKVLDHLDQPAWREQPLFAFIDPFGLKVPFPLVRRVLQRPQSEVLVTFMVSSAQRFPVQLEQHIDELVGQVGAARQLAEASPEARFALARDIYQQSLRRTARFVRHFSMFDRSGRHIYDLVFGTNSPKGLAIMKESMWKVDSLGHSQFSDTGEHRQTNVFELPPGQALAVHLHEVFRGQTLTVKKLIAHTIQETASFTEAHVREALRLLEQGSAESGRAIQVSNTKTDGKRRVGKTFSELVQVTFLETRNE